MIIDGCLWFMGELVTMWIFQGMNLLCPKTYWLHRSRHVKSQAGVMLWRTARSDIPRHSLITMIDS
jgi:hypothetical protein